MDLYIKLAKEQLTKIKQADIDKSTMKKLLLSLAGTQDIRSGLPLNELLDEVI